MLFMSYASPLIFFLHFFYLSPPLRIDLLHFQTGCRKRRLNPVLVFLCLFCVVVHLFCCVRFSFCIPNHEIGLWKRLRNDLFYVKWDVKPQLDQSIFHLFPNVNTVRSSLIWHVLNVTQWRTARDWHIRCGVGYASRHWLVIRMLLLCVAEQFTGTYTMLWSCSWRWTSICLMNAHRTTRPVDRCELICCTVCDVTSCKTDGLNMAMSNNTKFTPPGQSWQNSPVSCLPRRCELDSRRLKTVANRKFEVSTR